MRLSIFQKQVNGSKTFVKLMESKGYKFIEQLGSGYLFQRDEEKIHAINRQYTGYFTIWRYIK